ncbi:thiamine phosphate synthase [Aureispira anguillae]|uniref:Thiamine phosphate synthase n=1 Tax=Aureispira anguillae TaxID=2864201 RepID=A0A915YEU6_9BACT|nr:thiamine phosphate synthase [Aureispira anguillae]BDS11819.1 thiamine phosphate synthase [Aureispira anguillae]
MEHRLYSTPIFFQEEALILNHLFENGLPCLHLRKPMATKADCVDLLKKINAKFYARIILHQHLELVEEFNLLGVHLTESARRALSSEALKQLIETCHAKDRIIGTAIHQRIDLLTLPKQLDYVTLSPVFPSISKPNYQPTENWSIHDLSFPFQLIALGGVNARTLAAAYERGFKAVAFLGAVWNGKASALENYQKLCKKIQAIDPMR